MNNTDMTFLFFTRRLKVCSLQKFLSPAVSKRKPHGDRTLTFPALKIIIYLGLRVAVPKMCPYAVAVRLEVDLSRNARI